MRACERNGLTASRVGFPAMGSGPGKHVSKEHSTMHSTIPLIDGAYRIVWQDGSMERGRFATHLLAELEVIRLKNLYPALRTP